MHRHRAALALLALAACLTADPARASTSIEDALAGFAEPAPALPPVAAAPVPPPAAAPGSWRVGGRLRQRIVVNVAHDAPRAGEIDHRGLSSLQTRLDLEASLRPAPGWQLQMEGHAALDPALRLHGRQGIPPGFRRETEREAEIGRFFLRAPLGDGVDLTLGRQVVAWGRSESFRVTDVLNAVDRRLPGMTDIGDLRLAAGMVRLDAYAPPWSLGLVAIPERRFDRRPLAGSDFAAGALPPRDSPAGRFGAPDLGLALHGTFPGWDLSLYAARIHDRRPHVVATDDGPRRRHGRIRMLGAAGAATFGSWLLRAEAALLRGLRFTGRPERGDQATALLGADYAGIADTTLSLDAVHHHLVEYAPRLAEAPNLRRRNEPSVALRASHRLQNDTVELSLAATRFGTGARHGGMERLQATWRGVDGREFTLGAVFYRSGDRPPFRGAGDNDRLFLSLEQHF